MKKSNDINKLNTNLEHFELQLKPKVREQQKGKIISAIKKRKPIKKKNKFKISLVVSILLLIITSPLYSSTAAKFVEKIIPININNDKQSRIDINIIKLIKQSGYDYESVNISPNPFTLGIVLTPSEINLEEKKEVLLPKIHEFLEKEHIDDYKINISEKKTMKEKNISIKNKSTTVKPTQNIQWPKIVSHIYIALGGKKTYQIKSISYSEEENAVLIKIYTKLGNNKDSLMKVNNMEKALKEYFSKESTKKMMKSSNYKLRIYSDEKDILKEIKG